MLLEAWRECEVNTTTTAEGIKGKGDVSVVDKYMPRKVKMRRPIPGNEEEFEDYYDYHFPDAEKPAMGMKILEKAMLWKQQMENQMNNNVPATSAIDSNDIDIDDI